MTHAVKKKALISLHAGFAYFIDQVKGSSRYDRTRRKTRRKSLIFQQYYSDHLVQSNGLSKPWCIPQSYSKAVSFILIG